MTNAELITLLQQLPPESRVVLFDPTSAQYLDANPPVAGYAQQSGNGTLYPSRRPTTISIVSLNG